MRQRFIGWFERYERHISSVALVFGFAFDNFLLRRIDVWLDNILLITYISGFMGGVILINLYDSEILRGPKLGRVRLFAPFPMQFFFWWRF